MNEAATHAIIAASIQADREVAQNLRWMNNGHIAKAEARADVAAAAASQLERSRRAEARARGREEALRAGGDCEQILTSLFS